MPDDLLVCAAALLDILVFARSGPSIDALLSFFTSHAVAELDCDAIEVLPGQPGSSPPHAIDGPGEVYVSRHPVACGRVPWGELQLTYLKGPLAVSEVNRGRLFAEVLGAALASAAVDVGGPGTDRDAPALEVAAAYPDPDTMVALVLDSAEILDRMPHASTRARLALVVSRLAAVVGSGSWFLGVTHDGRLYDVTDVAGADAADATSQGAAAPAGPVMLSDFPARLRASEGGTYYADQRTGDDAERCALLERGQAAVVGAGGYDLDGRSWVVAVFSDGGVRLQHYAAVLAALVQAALSFPREAVVPRPLEPWVRAILTCSEAPLPEAEVRGIGALG